MCYVRAMPRVVRAVICFALALLVLLEATPAVAKMTMRSRSRGCEIAATKHRVTFFALPSERGASHDGATAARTPLVPLTVFTAGSRLAGSALRAVILPEGIAARSRAWLHVHRQRARAPDDPDPL
jgi:hypothetical protein